MQDPRKHLAYVLSDRSWGTHALIMLTKIEVILQTCKKSGGTYLNISESETRTNISS